MLARGLQRVLLLEAVFWIVLVWAGVTEGLASLTGAFALSICGALGLRLLCVAASFACALARGVRPPAGLRISLSAGVRLFWNEVLAFGLLFSVFQPFERFWMHRDRLSAESTVRPPILLVHGYGCNRACWVTLRQVLGGAGWRVATLNLEPATGALAPLAAQLAPRVNAVLRETGAEQLILVGHGMGGLVCRHYLAQRGEEAVRALITLGTPHQGTVLASFGVGQGARESEPGSATLAALPVVASIPWVSIYSVHDNFVMPQGPCEVAGVRNIALAGIGHLHMLFSRRVARVLLQALAGV